MQLKKIKPTLDPPSFIYQCKQPILNRSEKPIKNADDEYEYKEHPHKGSLPNLEFLMMHGITTNSHTDEWYDVFVPRNRKRKFSEGFTSISDTTLFTNKKVYLLNSGKGGTQYPKCTPLSVDEIMRHIGIICLMVSFLVLRLKRSLNQRRGTQQTVMIYAIEYLVLA